MKFVPKKDQLLIRREVAVSTTKGGLFIPDTGKEAPAQGKVLARGPKVEDTQVDETVLFGKYAGTEIELNGEKVLIMREEELLGSLIEDVPLIPRAPKRRTK
jgi:chaperonin GroES